MCWFDGRRSGRNIAWSNAWASYWRTAVHIPVHTNGVGSGSCPEQPSESAAGTRIFYESSNGSDEANEYLYTIRYASPGDNDKKQCTQLAETDPVGVEAVPIYTESEFHSGTGGANCCGRIRGGLGGSGGPRTGVSDTVADPRSVRRVCEADRDEAVCMGLWMNRLQGIAAAVAMMIVLSSCAVQPPVADRTTTVTGAGSSSVTVTPSTVATTSSTGVTSVGSCGKSDAGLDPGGGPPIGPVVVCIDVLVTSDRPVDAGVVVLDHPAADAEAVVLALGAMDEFTTPEGL